MSKLGHVWMLPPDAVHSAGSWDGGEWEVGWVGGSVV